jgi:glycolate oxidase iron-sulfur subunit
MFAENIKEDLHRCLKCGMCQPVCPTFKVTRMERHAPRGRAQMVKHYLEGDLSITKGLHEALMSCILCESCANACPSGVRLDRIFENVRMELHEKHGTKLTKRALFAALQNPMLMRLGARVARIGQRTIIHPLNLRGKIGNIPMNRLPGFNRQSFRGRVGQRISPEGKSRGRVYYFTGCATDLMNESVGFATLDTLVGAGYEVIIPQDQVCCSVPVFLSGARREALPNIIKNMEIFDQPDADAVVVDCATCGGGLKKAIPHLLEDLGLGSDRAVRLAAKVKDVTELVADRLETLDLLSHGQEPVRVTYHDPCHMIRSMKVSQPPREIIKALDHVDLVELPAAGECCGGAGAFQFEHVDISAGVTDRKKENIRSCNASIVATGCPGCNLTLTGNLYENGDPLVRHTIELLAERLKTRPVSDKFN